MTVLMAQVKFPAFSGISRDDTVNTFHFYDATPGGNPASVKTQLAEFYGVASDAPTPTPIKNYLSDRHRAQDAWIKVYDLDDPTERVPVLDETLGLTAHTGGAALPSELAVCISYEAAKASGAAQRRRRGRIYFGPVNTSTVAVDVAGDSRPILAMRQNMAHAAERLAEKDPATVGSVWHVYSPTNALTLGHDLAVATIASVWVDDEWDIQRRRGLRATSKYIRPIV